MITIQCANCKNKFTYPGRYDSNFEQTVGCPNCQWTASMFCFNFISTDSKDKPLEEAIAASCYEKTEENKYVQQNSNH